MFVQNSSHKKETTSTFDVGKTSFGIISGTTCKAILMFGRLSTISIYEIFHGSTFYDTFWTAYTLENVLHQILNQENKFQYWS